VGFVIDLFFFSIKTTIMNKHLNDLMEGLTAKVFRTFNASNTLQEQLDELTDPKSSVTEKVAMIISGIIRCLY
jgi:DNA topoisomerase-1